MASNKKMQENKPTLELNFTHEHMTKVKKNPFAFSTELQYILIPSQSMVLRPSNQQSWFDARGRYRDPPPLFIWTDGPTDACSKCSDLTYLLSKVNMPNFTSMADLSLRGSVSFGKKSGSLLKIIVLVNICLFVLIQRHRCMYYTTYMTSG